MSDNTVNTLGVIAAAIGYGVLALAYLDLFNIHPFGINLFWWA